MQLAEFTVKYNIRLILSQARDRINSLSDNNGPSLLVGDGHIEVVIIVTLDVLAGEVLKPAQSQLASVKNAEGR